MPKILVTGGCGYIGSHTIVSLLEAGYDVVSVDDHSNSHEAAYEGIRNIVTKDFATYNIDIADMESLHRVFAQEKVDAVIHFAAFKSVGESVADPMKYYQNNVIGLIHLLSVMQEHQVANIIFSSSCTVYGEVSKLPVTEETPQQPAESPYGATKQIGEQIIKDVAAQGSCRAISLRYFNPAGAHPSGHIGESAKVVALNLVPVITETGAGKREKCVVFGDDYDTRDGSCIRDYIHVVDLAQAHTQALTYLLDKSKESYDIFNLGIGEGVTVLEAIKAFEKVSGQALNYEIGPRRSGDIVAIYANKEKAASVLGWTPQYGIDEIMSSAWEWEQKRPY